MQIYEVSNQVICKYIIPSKLMEKASPLSKQWELPGCDSSEWTLEYTSINTYKLISIYTSFNQWIFVTYRRQREGQVPLLYIMCSLKIN